MTHLELDRKSLEKVFLLLVLLGVATVGIAAAKELPKTTHDGLDLVENTKLRAVYLKPGTTLDQYTKVALLDCAVAFEKDWQKTHNRQEISLENRINDKDMEKMKARLAEYFNKEFTKVLTAKGHEIVTTKGADVLVIRPAIVNLEVTAPDKMTAGMSRNFVASTGSMTLYMELYDSVSNAILARVIDPEAAGNMGGEIANRATNHRDADIILKRWATALADHLGAVSGK